VLSQPPRSLPGDFLNFAKRRHFRRLVAKRPVSAEGSRPSCAESPKLRGQSLRTDFSISEICLRECPETGSKPSPTTAECPTELDRVRHHWAARRSRRTMDESAPVRGVSGGLSSDHARSRRPHRPQCGKPVRIFCELPTECLQQALSTAGLRLSGDQFEPNRQMRRRREEALAASNGPSTSIVALHKPDSTPSPPDLADSLISPGARSRTSGATRKRGRILGGR
jgi:hypothetical protein